MGTMSLPKATKVYWKGNLKNKLFHHVSTNEVYGSLDEEEFFKETACYDPHSSYCASNASLDHFLRAFAKTYNYLQ
jgi:dTDP-glucose 4,6-dehydratase